MGSAGSRRSTTVAATDAQEQQQPQVEELDEDGSPRIVFITGCSTGIGLATAVVLASDADKRFKVYATMRNLGKKAALEEAAGKTLGESLFIKELDVTSEEAVNSLVKEIESEEGRIDVLVNNAGQGLVSVFECIPIDKAQNLFDANFFGVMRVLKAALPGMKARKKGRIINVSSIIGVNGHPFSEIYSASKFALEGLTESLAPTLRKFNIRCSLVEPGPVTTSFNNNAKSLREGIDSSTADDKTQALLQEALKEMYRTVTEHSQTAEEVADIIKNVILSRAPHLRYQTNSQYAPGEVQAKFSDATGDKAIDLMEKRFYPETK